MKSTRTVQTIFTILILIVAAYLIHKVKVEHIAMLVRPTAIATIMLWVVMGIDNLWRDK